MESIFLVNYLTNFIQLMILRLLKLKKLHIYFTPFYYKGLKSYPVSTKLPRLTVFFQIYMKSIILYKSAIKYVFRLDGSVKN